MNLLHAFANSLEAKKNVIGLEFGPRADVLRPEPPQGDSLRTRGPHLGAEGSSLWYAFFASSRRFFTVDVHDAVEVAQLQQLIERADIVLTCAGAFALDHVNLRQAKAIRPCLIEIAVSSFGDTGPWRDLLAPDLIAGALGGTIAPTGAPDTPPLKTFGELNFMVSGAYVAIAALSALHHARATGTGQRVAVPVHECIASCLEQVLMLNWYVEKMGRTRVLPRQAGTHWSMAYARAYNNWQWDFASPALDRIIPIAVRARRLAEQHFSLDSGAEAYHQVYESVCVGIGFIDGLRPDSGHARYGDGVVG